MIENRITPACPYIFPSARRRSGMAARQVRRSVVIRNLQIRLLAMDSDRTPLGKGKDVLHGAARAAPLRQSVEQPCIDFRMQPCHQRMRIEAFDFMLAVADLARAVCPFEFCNNGGAT